MTLQKNSSADMNGLPFAVSRIGAVLWSSMSGAVFGILSRVLPFEGWTLAINAVLALVVGLVLSIKLAEEVESFGVRP